MSFGRSQALAENMQNVKRGNSANYCTTVQLKNGNNTAKNTMNLADMLPILL